MRYSWRLFWLGLLVAFALGAGFASWSTRRHRAVEPVKIQDGQTIDFSSGQPVVTDAAADRAAIEKAKREMDEATVGITFPATKKPAPPEAPAK